jgi:Glycosyltransferase
MSRYGFPRATRSPRVLIVIENVSLARDHRARKQVDALLRAGYEVAVVGRRDPDNDRWRTEPGLRLYEYAPPPEAPGALGFALEYGYSLLAAAALVIRAAFDGGFAAIQVGHPPDIYSFVAGPLKLTGCAFVVDQRDLSPEVFQARYGRERGLIPWVLKRLERMSWRSADHIVCVNETLRRRIVDRGGIAPDRVTVVGNGPVLARTRGVAPDAVRKQGFPLMACWVGLMGPQDRVDLALVAIRELIMDLKRRDCLFVFIGDGEKLPSLHARARELGIEPWVLFTGWLDERECFSFLASADLGMDPNMQPEVTPVKCMEYMAFGLPVVAFDLPETRAMARDAAALAASGDASAFAEAIEALLGDPQAREVMGAKGRRNVEEHLAWDRQEATYLQVFAAALGSGSANRSPEPPQEVLGPDSAGVRQDLNIPCPQRDGIPPGLSAKIDDLLEELGDTGGLGGADFGQAR